MTASVLERHMRRVAHHLKDTVSFHYLDGPHTVARREDLPTADFDDGDMKAWWTVRKRDDGGWIYDGVEEALECLATAQAAAERRDGVGFHGILGFSQGGALASLVAALHADGGRSPLSSSLDHVVLASGFGFGAAEPDYSSLFASPIRVPSLHTIGERDNIVKPRTSEAGFKIFADAQLHRHPGGHVVPSGTPSLDCFSEFFAARAAALEPRARL